MTIIIKEIQVKTTVEKNPAEENGTVSPELLERIRREILEEVLIRKRCEEKKER